ncbi:MAG: hypothetical protein QME94_17830 [Anaerolineae bacterium]|nr:hypothetical protein [Anaerolineae bacterium]
MLRHVSAHASSATRSSINASTISATWAWIRCGAQWKTGRSFSLLYVRDVAQADASARQSRQHVGEIPDGVHLGELAAAEDGVGDRGAQGASVEPGEQEVLPRQRRADVEPLENPVVYRDDAVVEKTLQRELL